MQPGMCEDDMTRDALSYSVGDISALARSLHRQLAAEAALPGHLALLNMLARGAGFRNFQHFRASATPTPAPAVAAAGDDPAGQPETEPDMGQVGQVLRQFDGAGRLMRWPAKTSAQKLALWALWARLPKGEAMTERQISERLNHWHLFGDAAIIRRTLWEMKLISRTADSRDYRRIEQAPPATARALIRAVTARRG
jgi:hypothetical protein